MKDLSELNVAGLKLLADTYTKKKDNLFKSKQKKRQESFVVYTLMSVLTVMDLQKVFNIL